MQTEERKEIYTKITQQLKKIIKGEGEKRGIYLYGNSGTGKTHFIKNLLKTENYEMIYYDSKDVRNKLFVNSIFSDNISKNNIVQMMCGIVKKTVIVIDNMDELNLCDKKTLTILVKNMRHKKTKKNKVAKKDNKKSSLIPIICIGNYCVDKKIKELMKVCVNFEFKLLNDSEMFQLLKTNICNNDETKLNTTDIKNYLQYIQGDLRKFYFIKKTIENEGITFTNELINDLLATKTIYNSVKDLTQYIFNNDITIKEHSKLISETDRTTISLLWHENVINAIDKNQKGINFYLDALKNICFADYIYRIVFQHQIWQFNEMSSLIKTVYNNKLLHKEFKNNAKKIQNIRFTKIITKYATEFNNFQFISKMCQLLKMDVKDILTLFEEWKNKYGAELETKNNNVLEKIENEIIELDIITKNYLRNELPKFQKDINRMFRFLDDSKKNVGDFEVEIDELIMQDLHLLQNEDYDFGDDMDTDEF